MRCEKSGGSTYLSKSSGSFQDSKCLKVCTVHHYGKLVYENSGHKLLKVTDGMLIKKKRTIITVVLGET